MIFVVFEFLSLLVYWGLLLVGLPMTLALIAAMTASGAIGYRLEGLKGLLSGIVIGGLTIVVLPVPGREITLLQVPVWVLAVIEFVCFFGVGLRFNKEKTKMFAMLGIALVILTVARLLVG